MTDQSLPPTFQSQDQYDEWVDEWAEYEAREFGEYYEHDTVTVDDVEAWVHNSPNRRGDHVEWVRLYDAVHQFGHTPIEQTAIAVGPDEEWAVSELAGVVRRAVQYDVARETIGLVRDDDRVTIGGDT